MLDEHLVLPSYVVSHVTRTESSLDEEWPKEVKNDLPLLVAGAMRDSERGIESFNQASLVSICRVSKGCLPMG